MKAVVSEYGGSFGIELTAETPEDERQLLRFGMGRTDLRSSRVYVPAVSDKPHEPTRPVHLNICFGRHKKMDGTVNGGQA